MARVMKPNVYWVMESGPDRSDFVERGTDGLPEWYDTKQELHIPNCAYLLADEQSLLLDTLSPAGSKQIVGELEAILDDGLDYLVVSHPDVPHAGNTRQLLERYPECTLVAPRYGRGHELYHLDDAMHVGEGDTLDLGRYTVEFHEAPFPDAAVHVWMSEWETNTLFPIDWFGFPHRADEDMRFVEEFEHPFDIDRLVQFHGRVMFWYQYVDVSKVQREIEHIIRKFDPDIVAPAHGNPVRVDATDHLALMV